MGGRVVLGQGQLADLLANEQRVRLFVGPLVLNLSSAHRFALIFPELSAWSRFLRGAEREAFVFRVHSMGSRL